MSVKLRLIAALALIASLFATSLSASAQDVPPYDPHQYEFDTDEFYDVWARTDRPVQEGATQRTWMWGPGANTPLIQEPYVEAGDNQLRDVQYTDKSRMEMPWNDADPESPWFITQGLLAYEMMTGQVQVGDELFVPAFPAEIQVAGDPGSAGPTYATMAGVMDHDPRSEGNEIVDVITVDGYIFQNENLGPAFGVTDDYWVQETGFYVASVFWDFMQSTGTIWDGEGLVDNQQVVETPFYAVGFPTTPAFWAWVKVDDVEQNVLVQCFERRCLTYAPNNPSEWQVESGNVGQHYFDWRYNQVGDVQIPDEEDPAEATSFSVSPDDATNAVGDTHEITVTVLDQDSEPFAGAEVSATVTDGPHEVTNLTPDDATTGSDGTTTLSYEGTDLGEDTITVSVEGIDQDQTVTKTWADISVEVTPDDAENPYFPGGYPIIVDTMTVLQAAEEMGLTLDQHQLLSDLYQDAEFDFEGSLGNQGVSEEDINDLMDAIDDAGVNEHSFTVQVTIPGGDDDIGSYDVSVVNENEGEIFSASDQSIDDGEAIDEFTYQAEAEGFDTITVTVDGEDFVFEDAKEWISQPVSSDDELTLDPLTAGPNPLESEHTVNATLTDGDAIDPQAIEGALVTFDISEGPNWGLFTGGGLTDDDGNSSFTYTDRDADDGDVDTIAAQAHYFDEDGNLVEVNETEEAEKAWGAEVDTTTIELTPEEAINPYIDQDHEQVWYYEVLMLRQIAIDEGIDFDIETVYDVAADSEDPDGWEDILDDASFDEGDIDTLLAALDDAGLNEHTFTLEVDAPGEDSNGDVDVAITHSPDTGTDDTFYDETFTLDTGSLTEVITYDARGVGTDSMVVTVGEDEVEFDDIQEWTEQPVESDAVLTIDPLDPDPSPVGTEHTVEATLLDSEGGDPIEDALVIFNVFDGDDASLERAGASDSEGQTSMTYTRDDSGTDEISAMTAFLNDDGGLEVVLTGDDDGAEKDWFEPDETVTNLDISATEPGGDDTTELSIEATGTDLDGEEVEVCRDHDDFGLFLLDSTGQSESIDCVTVTLDSDGENVEELVYDSGGGLVTGETDIEFTATHQGSGETDSVEVSFLVG
ncbi:MAG: hypothetical protein EA415_05690 [Sphaerobacteraceae bacterium]|nr:MAG: hypothetical protein EA415_05690 [Sphaerobacteraceae bacterium]